MKKLTPQQERIMDYIRNYLLRNGESPTQQEIATALDIAHRGSISKHLSALVEKGYLHKPDNSWRGFRLSEDIDNSDHFSLPMAGKIAAGQPIEAIQGVERIDLHEYLLGPDRFMLTVEGNSMIDEGIHDGDMVVIRQQETASRGNIVVALIDQQEATLKYFYPVDNNQIELRPANSQLQPMIYPTARISIQGVLVAQIRKYL